MDVWAGFLIGFLGSFHCVGMCGPITLALPVVFEKKSALFLSRLLYNLGRVITYALFGAVLGLFSNRIMIIGLQEYVSITLGLLIVVYVLSPKSLKAQLASTSIYTSISNSIKNGFNKVSQKKSVTSFLLIGIINGFLPCGFVYVALAGALTTGGIIESTGFMVLFGLGTLPIMFVTSVAGRYINLGVKKKINKLIPVFALVLGIIFILRGLNLGIPYLSPPLQKFAKPNQEMMMHH
jgi:sulfite exporter TauE/SafE